MKKGRLGVVQNKKRGRCSGHCCANFHLPFSPEEIEARYTRWVKGSKSAAMTMSSGAGPLNNTVTDIWIIFPMLIYLGTGPMPKQVRKADPDPDRHHYSCKHWDQKTGDCTIYEHRPQMCREYPYSSKCNYAACTWKSRKMKAETAKERRDQRRAEKAARESLVRMKETLGTPKRKRKMESK